MKIRASLSGFWKKYYHLSTKFVAINLLAMNTCLNCDHVYKGDFCPNCGQKATTHRINWRSFILQLPQSLFNIEKGFGHTFKELTFSPRKALDAYLAGKRVSFFPPIQYAILGVTLYSVLQAFWPMPYPELPEEIQNGQNYDMGYEFGRLIRGQLKFFWLMGIVLFAMPAWMIFRKYNFTEHMVLSAYIIGHTAFLGVFSLLIYALPIMVNPLIYLLMGAYYFFLFRLPINSLGTIAASFGVILLGFMLFFMMPLFFYWYQLLFAL